ncbi:hypothetical protein [Bifidobacterium sp.]|jgi:hypothetical protein|uniref:hypothetical protein n=1 Tax=Bifidobacterium sp. TaxID=41200 RepID=UPI0025BE76CF|nr:hypothetical protein [Bifidobacterium sp.]MCH4209970.1 hypothetical protein [Bifidobacterium sp.]MCI1225252.1 hypothetical protein [Bifidobacterium sp.]
MSDFLVSHRDAAQCAADAKRAAQLDVVLLTGADRLSLDSVAFSLMDTCEGVIGITYDVRVGDGSIDPDETIDPEQPNPGTTVLRGVSMPIESGLRSSDSHACPMSDCCLTCTVKHDAARTLERLQGRSGIVLISLPIGVEGTPVAQYLDDLFSLNEWGAGMRIATIANAVGLDEFEERFFDDEPLCLSGASEEDGVFDARSTGAVVSRLIREAMHVLELPVVGAGCLARHVDAAGDCRCRDIIRAIADSQTTVYEDAHEITLRDLAAPIQELAVS